MLEKYRLVLDFDGNLTDETKQAEELRGVAVEMMAEILALTVGEADWRYRLAQTEILKEPEKFPWKVNGQIACYAYEGPYLLNTVTLAEMINKEPVFKSRVEKKFKKEGLDSVTACVNYIFHTGSRLVNPNFLPGALDFLESLIDEGVVSPVILTNSESEKVRANLERLGLDRGIEILGDTRQYVVEEGKRYQLGAFLINLKRSIYQRALEGELTKYQGVIVSADGFSLAGAVPLEMGQWFILSLTPSTPDWARWFVESHQHGRVSESLTELKAQAYDIASSSRRAGAVER